MVNTGRQSHLCVLLHPRVQLDELHRESVLLSLSQSLPLGPQVHKCTLDVSLRLRMTLRHQMLVDFAIGVVILALLKLSKVIPLASETIFREHWFGPE